MPMLLRWSRGLLKTPKECFFLDFRNHTVRQILFFLEQTRTGRNNNNRMLSRFRYRGAEPKAKTTTVHNSGIAPSSE